MNANDLVCKLVAVCIFLLFCNLQVVNAQVGIGTTSPDGSAELHVVSNTSTGGVLFPRMTTGQRDLISDPAAGLLIYNTSTSTFDYNLGPDGTSNWVSLSTGSTAETRAIHYNSTDGSINLHSGALVRLPLFSDEIFNDDATLFTIQADDATIQVNEAGRYRITVNVFFNLDEAEGLAMAIFEDDGTGNPVFPSRNGAAAVGNSEVTFGSNNFVTEVVAASMNLSTVLEFGAGDRFFIGTIGFPFGSTNTPSNVSLVAANGSRSNVIIEKLN